MNFLASWLLKLFTTIAGLAAARMTRSMAVVTAAITLFLAMTAAFLVALKATLTGIVIVLNVPPEFVAGWAAVAPDNLETCIAAIFGAKLIDWAYNLNKDMLGMYLGGI